MTGASGASGATGSMLIGLLVGGAAESARPSRRSGRDDRIRARLDRRGGVTSTVPGMAGLRDTTRAGVGSLGGTGTRRQSLNGGLCPGAVNAGACLAGIAERSWEWGRWLARDDRRANGGAAGGSLHVDVGMRRARSCCNRRAATDRRQACGRRSADLRRRRPPGRSSARRCWDRPGSSSIVSITGRWQRSVASRPLMRHNVTGTSDPGRSNHFSVPLLVAAVMKRAHAGTATTPAKPRRMIACGVS